MQEVLIWLERSKAQFLSPIRVARALCFAEGASSWRNGIASNEVHMPSDCKQVQQEYTTSFRRKNMRSNPRKQWIVFAITVALFIPAGVAQQKTQGQKLQTKTVAQSNRQGKKWQPLNVKPGFWESTRTWTTSGQMPIPAGMLDRLTPEH